MNPFNKPFNDWTVNDFNEAKKITNPIKVKQITTKHKVDDLELEDFQQFTDKFLKRNKKENNWKILLEELRNKFGEINYFNDKRINHRRIKITNVDLRSQLLKYLNKHYPELKAHYKLTTNYYGWGGIILRFNHDGSFIK